MLFNFQSVWLGLALVVITFWLGVLYGRDFSARSSVLRVRPSHSDRCLYPQAAKPLMKHILSKKPVAPTSDEEPFFLLGIISNPLNFKSRKMLREFSLLTQQNGKVRIEFVIGKEYFDDPPTVEEQKQLAREIKQHNDIVFVDGREQLPHVGKATEKSAAWWSTAPSRSAAKVFCKTDDDSLIHLGHLSSTLDSVLDSVESRYFLFSYIRWRGWLPFHRFQACGGGWGGPVDAWKHLNDPNKNCQLAEGPIPQGTGTLMCMPTELVQLLAEDPHFRDFQIVAKARNDFGRPCTSSSECASHEEAMKMWHHEDAGISFNMWKTVTRMELPLTLIHMPEKGFVWPWFSPKIASATAGAKAIVMHKVSPSIFKDVIAEWDVSLEAPKIAIDCSQTCTYWGWKTARIPCSAKPALAPPGSWQGFESKWNGSMCEISPLNFGFKCCFLRAEGKYKFNATQDREESLKLHNLGNGEEQA